MNAGQGSIAADFPLAAGTVPPGVAESGTGVFAGRIRLGINPLLATTNIDGNGFSVVFRNAGASVPFQVNNAVSAAVWNHQVGIDPFGNEWYGVNGQTGQDIRFDTDNLANSFTPAICIRGSVSSGGLARLVGVGTSFPNTILHVKDDTFVGDTQVRIENTDPSGNGTASLRFVYDTSFATIETPGSSLPNGQQFRIINFGAGRMALGVNNTEIVSIFSGLRGIVGINQTAPGGAFALDVIGSGNFVQNQNAVTSINVSNANINAAASARVVVDGGNGTGQLMALNVASVTLGSVIALQSSAQPIVLLPLNVEMLRATNTQVTINKPAAPTASQFEVNGTLATADPGAGKGLWRLGKKIAGAVVLDPNNSVQVMVDGVLVKLGIVV